MISLETLFGVGKFIMWFLCRTIGRGGFYSYFCCFVINPMFLYWLYYGENIFIFGKVVFFSSNFFILIMHCGWKLQVTAIHRH